MLAACALALSGCGGSRAPTGGTWTAGDAAGYRAVLSEGGTATTYTRFSGALSAESGGFSFYYYAKEAGDSREAYVVYGGTVYAYRGGWRVSDTAAAVPAELVETGPLSVAAFSEKYCDSAAFAASGNETREDKTLDVYAAGERKILADGAGKVFFAEDGDFSYRLEPLGEGDERVNADAGAFFGVFSDYADPFRRLSESPLYPDAVAPQGEFEGKTDVWRYQRKGKTVLEQAYSDWLLENFTGIAFDVWLTDDPARPEGHVPTFLPTTERGSSSMWAFAAVTETGKWQSVTCPFVKAGSLNNDVSDPVSETNPLAFYMANAQTAYVANVRLLPR